MRHPALPQPIGHPQQILSEPFKASLLLTTLALLPRPLHTGGDALLVHVQPAAARIENFHRTTPLRRLASDASKNENLLRVFSAKSGGHYSLCFPAFRATLIRGLPQRQSRSASVAGAAAQPYAISTAFSSFVVVPQGRCATHNAVRPWGRLSWRGGRGCSRPRERR